MGVMPKRNSRLILVLVCLLALGEGWLLFGGGRAAAASVDAKYFFTGTPQDQANKIAGTRTASFSKTQPTGTTVITQETSPNCVDDIPGNSACAFWNGPYSGTIDGSVEICWYWSSTNPAIVQAGTASVRVTFFKDPVYPTNPAQGQIQVNKIIGRQTVTVQVGTPNAPKQSSASVKVDGFVDKDLVIQALPTGGTQNQGMVVHYGYAAALSGFGPPGTACPVGGSTQTPTGTATSTQSPTATPSPTPTQTGTATSPGVRLKVSDTRPTRGDIVTATALLKKCAGHKGTTIQLQKKVRRTFQTTDTKRLNKRCKAKFKIAAAFKRATFRAFWPKQDQDHRAGRSKPKTIRTHPPR